MIYAIVAIAVFILISHDNIFKQCSVFELIEFEIGSRNNHTTDNILQMLKRKKISLNNHPILEISIIANTNSNV